jgi:hypothetical protein
MLNTWGFRTPILPTVFLYHTAGYFNSACIQNWYKGNSWHELRIFAWGSIKGLKSYDDFKFILHYIDKQLNIYIFIVDVFMGILIDVL